MLILAPTAQAVQKELNAPPPPPPVTADARMGAHLAQVEERLRQWQAALQPDTFAPIIEAERGRRALPEMRSDLTGVGLVSAIIGLAAATPLVTITAGGSVLLLALIGAALAIIDFLEELDIA